VHFLSQWQAVINSNFLLHKTHPKLLPKSFNTIIPLTGISPLLTQDYACQILSMFCTYSFNGATNQLLHPTSIPLIRVLLVFVYQSQPQIQDTKNSTKAHLNPANQHDTYKTDEPTNISRTKVHSCIQQQAPRNESATMGQKGA